MPEPSHNIGGNMGNSLDSVELLPEPDDPRILSAIDPSAVGFQDDWRAEITGWAPLKPTPITRVRGKRFIGDKWGIICDFCNTFALGLAGWLFCP